MIYLGGYSSQAGHGLGVAALPEDVLAVGSTAGSPDDPTFLAVGPGGRTLYAAHELVDGQVSAFAVGDGGKLLSGVLGTLSGAPGWLTTLLDDLPGRPTVDAATRALHATGGTLSLPSTTWPSWPPGPSPACSPLCACSAGSPPPRGNDIATQPTSKGA